MIDNSGNVHKPAGIPAGGQFSSRSRAEDAASLVPDTGSAEGAWAYSVMTGEHGTPEMASAALRSAALRSLPDADRLRFEMNYTDEGSVLVLTGIAGGEYDGVSQSELSTLAVYDDVDDIMFANSGAGHTGAELPGMRKIGDDSYVFDLRGAEPTPNDIARLEELAIPTNDQLDKAVKNVRASMNDHAGTSWREIMGDTRRTPETDAEYNRKLNSLFTDDPKYGEQALGIANRVARRDAPAKAFEEGTPTVYDQAFEEIWEGKNGGRSRVTVMRELDQQKAILNDKNVSDEEHATARRTVRELERTVRTRGRSETMNVLIATAEDRRAERRAARVARPHTSGV